MTLQQLISDTVVRWAQECVIENPALVRAMFALLHRQYEGLRGQMGTPLHKAYTISQVSVEDTMALLASLVQIRSLLSVRMGKEEERLMIRGLGYEWRTTASSLLALLLPLHKFQANPCLDS